MNKNGLFKSLLLILFINKLNCVSLKKKTAVIFAFYLTILGLRGIDVSVIIEWLARFVIVCCKQQMDCVL